LTTLLLLLLFLLPLFSLLPLLHKDYILFLSLGPGGTPPTPLGYLRIKFLSLFAHPHPRRASPLPPTAGYLHPSTLPPRRGSRPTVVGIAPHRQTNQHAHAPEFAMLERAIRRVADDPGNAAVFGVSCIEKHGPALFSCSETREGGSGAATTDRDTELLHAHPWDGSMHIVLHPGDVRVVLMQGWGERHPLGRGGWLRQFVPEDFMLIYAPRNAEEVEIVMRIVEAACWWRRG
ncbi:hypothetical protein P152DRAFT_376985, partial [Eremomyces bilateralis CBS 781.70]